MNNIKETVAKNLTKLRQERNLTQSEVAQMLNYTDKSVSKWEHAETTPPIDVLKQLADLYEVSLDYLVSDRNEDFYDNTYTGKRNTTNKIWARQPVMSSLFLLLISASLPEIVFVLAFLIIP